MVVVSHLDHYNFLLQNTAATLLQNATSLLQNASTFLSHNATVITICNGFVIKCDTYYKMSGLLQNVSVKYTP